MPKACVCYTINDGYLLPALVSAVQARRHTDPATTDVMVMVIGEPSEANQAAAAVAQSLGVILKLAPKAQIEDHHVMFARLFADVIAGGDYQRLVYIDGDTQVRGSLAPLVEATIPEGCFLASRDPAVLFAQLSPQWRRRTDAYRREVGYERPYADYFNSGVLIADRAAWPQIRQAALTTLQGHTAGMRFADQDILNLAVGDRCRLISNRWNFPGFLIGSQAERTTRPHIYHFMSNPRPWIEPVRPWGEAWRRPYVELISQYPQLRFLEPRKSLGRRLRYWLQQEFKMLTEYGPVGVLAEPEAQIPI